MDTEIRTQLTEEEILADQICYVSALLRSFHKYSYHPDPGKGTDIRLTPEVGRAVTVLGEALLGSELFPNSELTFVDAVLSGNSKALVVCARAVNFLEAINSGKKRDSSFSGLDRSRELKKGIESIYENLVSNGIHFLLVKESVKDADVVGRSAIVFPKHTKQISEASHALARFVQRK